MNYAFADGHVKWYRSGSKTTLERLDNTLRPFGQNPTFRIR
jgi:hypothetical protein